MVWSQGDIQPLSLNFIFCFCWLLHVCICFQDQVALSSVCLDSDAAEHRKLNDHHATQQQQHKFCQEEKNISMVEPHI